jgi:hypothetical protein
MCGLLVAHLGWLASARGRRHILLMTAMQASATVGAWSACATQRAATSKSPPPPELEEGAGAGAGAGASADDSRALPSAAAKRALSTTLPRSWRYHAKSGLFEHKRSGRLQYEPPSTAETGSPLHVNLPPCDEERGGGCWDPPPPADRDGHASDSDSGSDSWHGTRRSPRVSRSRTWTYASRAGADGAPAMPEPRYPAPIHPAATHTAPRRGRTSAPRSQDGPMSVWELHAALGGRGEADAAGVGESPRRPPAGTGRARNAAAAPHAYEHQQQGSAYEPTSHHTRDVRDARRRHHEHGG